MVVVNNIEADILPARILKPNLQTNWAQNIVYGTNTLHEVISIEEIQALLQSQEKVTTAGTGHTFNFIADNLHSRLSLRSLHQVLHLDEATRTVVVDAGIKYGQLCSFLDSRGFALQNLASLTELSIAGAISTAAHGSGNKNGNLATSVSALEMVTGNGEIVKLSRQSDGEVFSGAVVGLGVITQITLDIHPAFTMRQFVYKDLPLAQVIDHFDAIMGSGYTVSLFTDWQDQRMYQMWLKVRVEDGQTFEAPHEFFGAKLLTENVNVVRGMAAERCTEQLGVPGPSYQRLPHFREGYLPGVGDELQSEYFMPRHHAAAAILSMERLRDQISPILFESEIRTIAADDLWMSTCYGRDSVAIHFCWKNDWPAVQRLLPIIESKLAPFDPRPHWGKLFAMSPALVQSKYEKLVDFVKLAAKYDPKGKFRNEFLNTNVFTNCNP